MWTQPIYDRTEADTTNKTPKGRVNDTDINRLEGNCRYLADYGGVSITTKEWNWDGLPNASDYARIRNNINAIRSQMQVYSSTPNTPPNPLNTWDRWNDAEKILFDVHDKLVRLLNAYDYTGELHAGDKIGVL